MPTIGSTEGDFTVDATARTNRAAGATVAGTAGIFSVVFEAADATGAAAGNTLEITSGGKTATVALFGGGNPLYTGQDDNALLVAINAQLDAAGIALTATAPANKFVFTQKANDVGSTVPTFTAKLDNAAETVTTATAPVQATGPQISTLELSSIFGTLREGDTVAYTIDGRAASATISSTQNPDKSWTMTNTTSNSTANGKTAGAVSLSFIDSKTLILTGTNPNEPFVVENVQVTRGIGADVAGTDISTFTTATSALSILDAAVASVNMKRAELGATANRLEYASDNMANVSMNARAARSRVEDADYATETTELARTQIIQQAGTAMLAQANQSTQSVLKLLQ
jgi:flagellin